MDKRENYIFVISNGFLAEIYTPAFTPESILFGRKKLLDVKLHLLCIKSTANTIYIFEFDTIIARLICQKKQIRQIVFNLY